MLKVGYEVRREDQRDGRGVHTEGRQPPRKSKA